MGEAQAAGTGLEAPRLLGGGSVRADRTSPDTSYAHGTRIRRVSPAAAENQDLERRIAHVRIVGAALCSVAAPFLGLGRSVLAVYLCMAAVAGYNILFGRLVPSGRPRFLVRAYAYGFFDITTASVLITLTGGAVSPFALAYFPVVVHAAIRFGRHVALAASAASAAAYVGASALAAHQFVGDATTAFTVGFIVLTAVFAGLLSDRIYAAEYALARRLDRERTLNEAGSRLTESLDWSVVTRQVVEQGRVLADAGIAILDLHGADERPRGADASPPRERTTEAIPSDAHLARLLLQSGLPDSLPPAASDAVTIRELGTGSSVEGSCVLPRSSLLRAPVFLHGRWAGDLLLVRSSGAGQFSEGDAEVVRTFANHAALALENAWLYERAREQAETDPITALPNHRALKERLEAELARAKRHGHALCALMLDIDHFKAYNDSFGHAAGDLALQAVADVLVASLGRGDCAARYAGEEFVVILPEMDEEAGAAFAERVRGAVAELVDDAARHLSGPITVSIGVAAYPHHGEDRDTLLQAADLAMYLAKHMGRNQVCLAGEVGTMRGLDALLAQVLGHISLPTARWGPHMVADLERRLTRMAALQIPEEDHSETIYRHTVQTVTALATTIDAKDHYTEGHSRRVSALGAMLAGAAGCEPDEVETVRVGGLLHDIGKIAISESVLNKPGKLTEEEWVTMRSHPDVGVRILAPISALKEVLPIVRHHHERWDGNGYPRRLSREEIHLGARIIGICDAYDTMVSDRPYRSGVGHDEAVRRLRAASASQFDPVLVRLFTALPLERLGGEYVSTSAPPLAASLPAESLVPKP